jgi:hypothetical protein
MAAGKGLVVVAAGVAALLLLRGKKAKASEEPSGEPTEPPKGEVPVKPSGNAPFTVRSGDIAHRVAQYYTGDGKRFKELEPLNPQMGPLVTILKEVGEDGDLIPVSDYKNWQIGLKILLPAAWDPFSKPYPVPGKIVPTDPPVFPKA